MSDQAQRRIQAIGQQLSSPSSSSGGGQGSSSSLPPIRKLAAGSSSPRAKDKVVIITGANSPLGIGRATAHQYAESGARAVYVCDFDGTHLEAHKREITAAFPGVEVHAWQFDAADEGRVKAVVDDALGRYGRLDVFFANAGIIGLPTVFTEVTDEDFMNVLRVNTLRYGPHTPGPATRADAVYSVFLAAKHAAPAMKKTCSSKPQPGGSIIATASVAGLRSNAGPSAYSASKAAVVSLAQTLSYQLAGTGVRVNAICPGIIETGMTAPVFEAARSRGTEKRIGQLNPLKRGAHADEVARVALFLGTDEASYVNGQAWAVDGGLSAGHPYVIGKLS